MKVRTKTSRVGRGSILILTLFSLTAWAQNQLPPGTQSPDEDQQTQSASTGRDTAEGKMEQHDYPAARTLLEKYLGTHPADARALFDLGYVEDATGHENAAATAYRKALAADPKQFESHLALGLLLAHQNKLDEAREELKKASEAGPLKGYLGYESEELVSSDFKGNSLSSIVDSPCTMVVGGNCVKVISWYDNEWGYSCRVVDLAVFLFQ